MRIAVYLCPFLFISIILFLVVWFIYSINSIVSNNRKIRRLLEHHFSLEEKELVEIYTKTKKDTWGDIFSSKITIVLVAMFAVFTFLYFVVR